MSELTLSPPLFATAPSNVHHLTTAIAPSPLPRLHLPPPNRLIITVIPPANSCCTLQETERLMADSPPGITAAPHEDNLRYFDVTIAGPGQSPYEGE